MERGGAVARLAQEHGLSVARLSQGPAPAGSQVVVLDLLGKLAAVYALAVAAFVGGSLVAVGGHNLLEPAAQGVPVVFGPRTHNFLEMAQDLEAAGGGLRIATGAELTTVWGELLRRPGPGPGHGPGGPGVRGRPPGGGGAGGAGGGGAFGEGPCLTDWKPCGGGC